MRTKGTFSLAITLILLMAAAAAAHLQSKGDPDDWTDRLDIKTVRLDHTADRMSLGIRTFEDWGTSAIQSGKRTIYFTLDTTGGAAAEYGINILRNDKDGLTCLVTKEPKGELVAHGRAVRQGANGAACNFRRGDVEAAGHKLIRWDASVYNLQTYEHDDAPDSGMLKHQL